MVITGVFFLAASLSTAFRERFSTREQVKSFLKGEGASVVSKNFIKKKKIIKTKIRTKFMLFSFFLILVISVGGGAIIGWRVMQLEKRNLARDLKERINLLQTSIIAALPYYMPQERVLEIQEICTLVDMMEEIHSIVILGPKTGSMEPESNSTYDYVWYASNRDIVEKVDYYDAGFGNMRYIDSDIADYKQIIEDTNVDVTATVTPIILQLGYIGKQLIKMAENPDDYDLAEITESQDAYFALEEQVKTNCTLIAQAHGGVFPYFDIDNIDLDVVDYTAYQPIVYRTDSSSNYVHGVVIINFCIEELKSALYSERRKVNLIAIIIAVVANVLAIIGSFVMATIITKPINELEEHLKRVGLTKDRTKLDKMQINITSQDEIGRLGAIVNEMTKKLGAAAREEQLLADAKSVQQAFLPLVETESGAKRNVSYQKSDNIEVFGYFEGASTVSGDYFDYKRLDANWYVVIKCDASGHGFSAAIIMTIIATLFRNYFNNWSYDENGIGINHFVNQVNQFISKLGIEGRFASMLVCLMNSSTGDLYMCNAGDNIVHIYDSVLKKMKTVELFSAPVVGPFNSVLINQMGGYKVEKINLKPGDMIVLYTDGIEEAVRVCRNENFEPIQVDGDLPGTKKPKYELFGERNILKVIEAVLNKEVFILEKDDNPDNKEVLAFDFTTCPGTTEDVVTAVAAIEKVFRMYKPSSVLKTDFISVDKQIDHFLKKYFKLYNEYCINKVNSTEDYVFSNYLDYEYLMEDEQKDDLTFLVVKYS